MLLPANITTSHQKCARPYFHLPANKRLIQTIITASRKKQFAGLSFWMANFVICTGFNVWTWMWRNRKWNWKLQFCYRVLYYNKLFNKQIRVIRCFQTHCEIPNMGHALQTKQSSLVDTRWLTESALSTIVRITAVTFWAKTDLKLFWGGVQSHSKCDFLWLRITLNIRTQF